MPSTDWKQRRINFAEHSIAHAVVTSHAQSANHVFLRSLSLTTNVLMRVGFICGLLSLYIELAFLMSDFTRASGFVSGVPGRPASTALAGSLKNNLLIRAARGEKVEKTPVSILSLVLTSHRTLMVSVLRTGLGI